ncbi:hypothetical protein V2W30_41160 (plasmid) [Streptomyces sp. Q6]|uniref:Uncharacterized protein n=1 Tax=Streptomyces citrinus TaxID=3118173 RepID=A0ACD5AQS8_9ACTN
MNQRFVDLRRQLGSLSLLFAVIALLITAIVFVICAPGVPAAWWPQTGGAFAASPTSPSARAAEAVTAPQGAAPGQTEDSARPAAPSDSSVCDTIVGPAHAYCLRGQEASASAQGITLARSWPVGALALGLGTLYVLSRRRRRL